MYTVCNHKDGASSESYSQCVYMTLKKTKLLGSSDYDWSSKMHVHTFV